MQPRVQPVSPGDAGSGGSRSGRPRWIALLIVVPLFVAAGLIYTGGPRLGQSTEQLAGFDIQSTTTTVGFTGDLTAGWSGSRLGVWGRFVEIVDSADGLLAIEQKPSGSRIWSSTDGAGWTPLTESEMEFVWIEDLATVEGGYVAAGRRSGETFPARPAAWTSDDGIAWDASRAVPTNEFYPGFEGTTQGSMNVLHQMHDGLLVAGGVAGAGGALWYSVDGGDSWELAFKDPVVSEVFDLLEGPDGLVAVGHRVYSPCLWRSVDGITWERDEESTLTAPEKPEYPWQLLVTETLWLAVGGDRHRESREYEELEWPRRPPVLWTSPDASAWRRDLIDELTNVRFTSLVEGGPGLVAAGFEMAGGVQQPGMWWSGDGREWQGTLLDDGGAIEDLIWWGDQIVAVGHQDFGPSVWIWDVTGTFEISASSGDEFLNGAWVDRGLVSSTQLWNPQRLGDTYVAFGDETIWRSPDGFLWSSTPFDEVGLDDMRWAGEIVAYSGSAPYYLSGWSDGDRWILFESDDGLEWSEMYRADAAAAGGALAVNEDRLLRLPSWEWQPEQGLVSVSGDGAAWFELDPPQPDRMLFDAVGLGTDFFVLVGADWGASASVWRLDSDNAWEPLGEPGVIDPWSLDVVTLEGETLLMVRGGQGLSVYGEADAWRSLELPVAAGSNTYFEVQALRYGLLGSMRVFSEDFNWPARLWYSEDAIEWIEIPPLASSDLWGSIPVAGFNGLVMFELSEEGTRLWEWQAADARSRVGSK